MRPGPEGKVNALVHKACLDLDITHIESLCNLEALLGRGQFTFIGLPMKWRGGTAFPIPPLGLFVMLKSPKGGTRPSPPPPPSPYGAYIRALKKFLKIRPLRAAPAKKPG